MLLSSGCACLACHLGPWRPPAYPGDPRPGHASSSVPKFPNPPRSPHTHDTANDTTAQLLCGPRALARLSRTLATSRPLPL